MAPLPDNNFDEYLNLKSTFDIRFKGINFNQVLAPQFMQLSFGKNDFDAISLRKLSRLLYTTRELDILADAFLKNDTVITYYVKRNDYLELLASYLGPESKAALIYLHDLPVKKVFNPFNIIYAIKQVWCLGGKLSVKKKIYIALHLVHYLNIFSSLKLTFKNTDLSNKKHIAFNSAYELETLLVQYFIQKQAKTYHISHGLSYINYDTKAYDAVNGENLTATNILVWGESSKNDLIKNYNREPASITVVGNPKYKFKTINIQKTFKKCVVFLGRPIYDKDNIVLIALLKEISTRHNIDFVIKAHPFSNLDLFVATAASCDKISFVAKNKTVLELLEKSEYDFAIAYNTTAYYEAMYYDMICLRYSVNENEKYLGLDDKFNDIQSFENVLERFKGSHLTAINQDIQKVLIDNLGMGIETYKNIFN